MDVNRRRLRSDIETNAKFGAIPSDDGWGRTVLTGMDDDRKARQFFSERLRDAGLTVQIDAVGNIVGRWEPESADPDRAPVVTGSHLDSVPSGGIFDGPLGVYAGLESIRTLQEANYEPDRPVHVVSFTEEEGQRFGGGLIGSSVAAGQIDVAEALSIEDSDGIPLGDALADIGFRGDGRITASEWDSWIEVHVEQASKLESESVPVGVVSSIAGLSRCEVEIIGEANHAGTTPMGDRSDALAAASELVLDVENAAENGAGVSDTAVATIGKLSVSPNAPNVIAGGVSLTIDIRDIDEDSISTLIETARTSAYQIQQSRDVQVTFEHTWDRPPIRMSDRTRNAITAAANQADVSLRELHSGAGHDTMLIAQVTDASLIFAPSENGISHNPREWTNWEDASRATRVLAGAIADLATVE